jgi:integrase
MSVTLREKPIAGDKVSLYLDIYHNRARWPEFLNIHVSTKRPTQEDRDKRRLANEIRAKREQELIVQDNGLIDKKRKLADFIEWYETRYLKNKINARTKKPNPRLTSTILNIKLFMGARLVKTQVIKNGRKYWKQALTSCKPLSFVHITEQWCMTFQEFLLQRVSNNTAWDYMSALFTALEKAVKQEIIPNNPMRKIDSCDRIKLQDIFRTSLTLEQLQMLADTPCNIHSQIKQAFFFSSFTGLRWSDFSTLKWSEVIVKGEDWYIYFDQQKTKHIEYLPLSEQAIEILKERKQERLEANEKSAFVFPDIKDEPGENKRYNWFLYNLKKWGRAARAKYGEDCGITDKAMKPHTGRHSFATNTLEASDEGDLYTVSKLLGHKTLKSSQIYAHVRDKRKMAAVKALPKINLRVVHKAA